MESLRSLLETSGCTLVVANNGVTKTFSRRGVADLLFLLDNNPAFLRGAKVADKIIGKAAAALMITGGVREVFTPKITIAARDMLQKADIAVTYREAIPFVENRIHTGRCPLDSLCSNLSSAEDMCLAIRNFLSQNN